MTGPHVRKLRALLGLTLGEFADLLAVHASTVMRWESASGDLPPIGLAQRQLLLLIGRPELKNARAIAQVYRSGGRVKTWHYLTGRTESAHG